MTENVIDDADSVSADAGTVSAYAGSVSADAGHLSDLKPERSARQDQNRDGRLGAENGASRVASALRIVGGHTQAVRETLDREEATRRRHP